MSSDKGKPGKPLAPLDSALFEPPEMRAALAARDVGTVYRRLTENGVSQHRIARCTGQSQSEVCEILQGRTVSMYDVLVRICRGLGVAREAMGLSYYGSDGSFHGLHGAYAEGVTVTQSPKEVTAQMRRRAMITAGAVAAFGHAVLGALAQLPGPSPVSLPTVLGWHHVARVRDTTRRLGEAGHGQPSDPDVCSAAATRATRLASVDGAEPIRRALRTAVAELHIEARRAAHDAGLYDRAMHHSNLALEIATEAGDAYLQSLILTHAGMMTTEAGHPDDGLKMLQMGQVTYWKIPRDDDRLVVVGEGRAALEACALADSAIALAALGHMDLAAAEMAKSRQLWRPTRNDPFGDTDRAAARLELNRGRLDVAEQYAAASVRRWDGINTGGRTRSGIVLATVYVRAGEPRGLTMAKTAIDAVAQLDSPRTRWQLAPLIGALDDRPGADAHELARAARKVAVTTRA